VSARRGVDEAEVQRRSGLVAATRLHALACCAPIVAIFAGGLFASPLEALGLGPAGLYVVGVATAWCAVQSWSWLGSLRDADERFDRLGLAYWNAVIDGEYVPTGERGSPRRPLADVALPIERERVARALGERWLSHVGTDLDQGAAAYERLEHYLGHPALAEELGRKDLDADRRVEMEWVARDAVEVRARLAAWRAASDAILAAVDRGDADFGSVIAGVVAAREGLRTPGAAQEA
jgi:hypothetical protein